MAIFCPACGRSIPNDSRVCAYCGKPIPAHGVQTAPEPEKKEKNIALIIVAVILILVIVPIALAATVYYYVNGMVGYTTPASTPEISFFADISGHNITVASVSSPMIYWSNLEISGIYSGTTSNHYFVTVGDKITGCSGNIIITYQPTHEIIYSYTFV